jgi:hypothetical protein
MQVRSQAKLIALVAAMVATGSVLAQSNAAVSR